MYIPKRQTGRTTRLIQRAKLLESAGMSVYIIVADIRQANRFKKLLGNDTAIKIEIPDSLGNFDWNTLSLRGAHPNCFVLVDHYAIECRYQTVLNMLHAFDG